MYSLDQKPTWKDLAQDSQRRRILLSHIIEQIPTPDADTPDAWGKNVVFSEDIPFLLDKLEMLESQGAVPYERLAYVAHLLHVALGSSRRVEDSYETDLELISNVWRSKFEMQERDSALRNQFDHDFVTNIESDRAKQLQKSWQLYLTSQREDQERAAKNGEDPAHLIESQLIESETGQPYVWTAIIYNLEFSDDGERQYPIQPNSPLELVGWKNASEETKARLVECARQFLVNYSPKFLKKVNCRWIYHHKRAAFQAFCLLYDSNYLWIEQLPISVWEKWTQAIIMASDGSGIYESVRYRFLLECCWNKAPQVVIEALSIQFAAEIKDDFGLCCLEKMRHLPQERLHHNEELEDEVNSRGWSFLNNGFWHQKSEICGLLLKFLKRRNMKFYQFEEFARALLQEGDTDAIEYVKRVAKKSKTASADEKTLQKSVSAAVVLCEILPDGDYKTIWPLMQTNPQFGRQWVERLAIIVGRHHSELELPFWTGEQLGQLYLWMREQYPKEKDLDVLGFHQIESLETIQRMRDNLSNRLARLQSKCGTEQLRLICAVFPDDKDLAAQLDFCEQERLKREWQPASISQIIALGHKTNMTLELPSPQFGIVTALPHEFKAMKALLNDAKEYYLEGQGAGRRFTIGTVPSINGKNHLVALTSPLGKGNNLAGIGATQLMNAFPSVQHLMMCGIAGGAPNPDKVDDHVRLGDIVVSGPKGIIQYDLIKKQGISGDPDSEIPDHSPRPTGAEFLEATRLLETDTGNLSKNLKYNIARSMRETKFRRPNATQDVLYGRDGDKMPHPKDLQRSGRQPRIFYGAIGAANQVLRDPIKRDSLRDEYGVRAIEMEGSGIADAAYISAQSYVVIRGICDYCDPHKGDDWQPYAAVVAAAYVRVLLESMPFHEG